MNDHIGKWKINLTMAGSTYPVWIQREDEETVRKVAAMVDEKINHYRAKWPTVSDERLAVMTAYLFALDCFLEQQRNDTLPYTDKIRELTDVLERYMRPE